MSDNPYESSDTASDAIEIKAKARWPLRAVGIVVVGMLLVALLLPFRRTVREPARRNGCINKLREIALALGNYESEHGTLPPAYTTDEEGNRLHSWRTLILPYLEQKQLYETIDLSKPWDDPVNAKARELGMWTYTCPSALHVEGLTTYLGIVGPDCVFTGAVPRALSEIKGDSGNEIVVVEVDSDQAVHWMSPRDADENTVLGYDLDSNTNHSGVILVAFLDGRVEIVPLASDPDERREILAIPLGEKASDEADTTRGRKVVPTN